ncbi:MAG: hypothetical protein J0I01_15230 [Stenotrophomonas nitritireducens]|nr:hypothetical protein [Stenotrophomonas nitritireducens]MBN8793576.1 hypothetical protein [Stenotrophomonas nitritireducens]MBN8797147.1 hypothetical protein [Stenotrophomonas nitritireducens]
MEKLLADWRSNLRLRIGGMVALVILLVNLLAAMEKAKETRIQAYERDARLAASMQAMSREQAWPARADEAQLQLEQLQVGLSEVERVGQVKAEMQVRLARLAQEAGIATPSIKVEDALEVPDHPNSWQVVARLEGTLPPYGHGPFVRALAEELPWLQVERMELDAGNAARASVVVRGYYLKSLPAEPAADRPVRGSAQ